MCWYVHNLLIMWYLTFNTIFETSGMDRKQLYIHNFVHSSCIQCCVIVTFTYCCSCELLLFAFRLLSRSYNHKLTLVSEFDKALVEDALPYTVESV